MSTNSVERNLLFGVLALQNNFIDQGDLVAAFHLWSADKSRSLGRILIGRGVLAEDDHALIEVLVDKHSKKNHGDVLASLGAVADSTVRDLICSLDVPEVRNAVSCLPTAIGRRAIQTLEPLSDDQRSRYQLTQLYASGGLERQTVGWRTI